VIIRRHAQGDTAAGDSKTVEVEVIEKRDGGSER
jgi:hypothetical protein